MSKRVCFFFQGMSGGGAERSMINLMRQFVARDICVDLLLCKREGVFVDQVPKEVSMTVLGTRLPRKSIGALVGYLKDSRPDALIAAFTPSSVVALTARKMAGVSTKVGISVQVNTSVDVMTESPLRRKLTQQMVRALYPTADLIAAVSAGVADDLARYARMPRSRIDVVYNPVITDDIFDRAKEPVDHPWFAPGEPPVILSVGRLAPQKDQIVLIDAFAKLRAARPCRLMVLGEGEERSRLEARIAELGIGDDVSLPGFATNPFAYMANSAVFALSSRYEGLPTVLIEALACGTQVVSTDCPNGPQEILHGGKYGGLVPMGDPGALAEAIARALVRKEPPPAESWMPYRAEASADRFCKALL